jgi:site-specific DNA recombinase
MKMKKAVLMARVSSDEQAKGYSLDVQLDNLRRYCDRNAIMVSSVFKEDFSAKTFERPAFTVFLKQLKKNKGSIDVLLFTTWDRFSRNTSEAYMMINELKKLGVQPQAIEQPIDLSIPENKAMLAFYLAIPEIENDRRSLKVLGGIRGARKEGRISCSAPRGYSNKRDELNKPIIVPNEFASIIISGFHSIIKGVPQNEILKEFKKMGLNMPKSQFYSFFRNPLYCGLVRVPASDSEPEYYTKGIHQPLISEEIFWHVNNILDGKKVKNNRPSFQTMREDLPLRGILLCSKCGGHITGSASRSRTGKKHFYYHCNSCKKERFKAEHANNAINLILSSFRFSKDIKNLYGGLIKSLLGKETGKDESRIKSIQKQIQLQESRLDNIQDILADGKISIAEYQNLKAKYTQVKELLVQELNTIQNTEFNLLSKLEKSIKLITNLEQIYHESDLATKTKLLGSIFPEKIVFDGAKCRTKRINELLKQTLMIDRGLHKIKSGQIFQHLDLSTLVARRGVEPLFKE